MESYRNREGKLRTKEVDTFHARYQDGNGAASAKMLSLYAICFTKDVNTFCARHQVKMEMALLPFMS